MLGVSRQSFYAWHDRGPSAREQTDRQLLAQIRQIHRASRGTYGAPRVHAELRDDHGVRVGRKRVARLMRDHGLVGCHRRRRRGLTRPDPQATPAPDLVVRLIDPGAPGRTWDADISYIPTQQGWLYLAAVPDGCSRRVVGWATAEHLRVELALDALQMALAQRQPAAGLIHHSDSGSPGSTPPASTPRRSRRPGCARAWAGWRPASTSVDDHGRAFRLAGLTRAVTGRPSA